MGFQGFWLVSVGSANPSRTDAEVTLVTEMTLSPNGRTTIYEFLCNAQLKTQKNDVQSFSLCFTEEENGHCMNRLNQISEGGLVESLSKSVVSHSGGREHVGGHETSVTALERCPPKI